MIDLKKFDRTTRALLNDIKKELNFKVRQIRDSGPALLQKSVREALLREKKLRHVIPHVKNFTIKTNKLRDPVIGAGFAIKFRKLRQVYKIRMVVTKSNASARVFWSLAVAKGGRKALGPTDLSSRFSAFGVRLNAVDIRGKTARQVERLRQSGQRFAGDNTTKIIVPFARVGPVKPYYDWIFHSEITAFLNMKKFLKQLDKTRRIQSI